MKKIALAILFMLLFFLSRLLPFREKDARLDGYLQILLEHKHEIKTRGDVLEVLVRDLLSKTLPREYKVIGNVQYFCGSRLTGELDIVLLKSENGDEFVVAVEEIKMWRNYKNALRKAMMQLDRFNTNLERDKITRYDPSNGENLDKQHFSRPIHLGTWGPQNAVSYGFTHEFDLTVDEGAMLYRKVKYGKI